MLPQAKHQLDNIDTMAIDWANEISIPNKTHPLADWENMYAIHNRKDMDFEMDRSGLNISNS